MNKLLIIAGATGTGKTEFAKKIYDLIPSVLISADSMQVYKNCDIGTAKITKEEQINFPHELIDIKNIDEKWTVADFVENAKIIITNANEMGKRPIIVGGTGLYIESLLFGYNFQETESCSNVRNAIQKYLKKYGNERVFNFVKKFNVEEFNDIDINNTHRLCRALEICILNRFNKGKINIMTNNLEKQSEYDYKLIFLDRERQELYNKINKRVDEMMAQGLLEEAKFVYTQYKNNNEIQVANAIGYKELFDYFDNKASLEECVEIIKQHSRNYAKRQITWYKRYSNIEWVNIDNCYENIVEKILNWAK